MPTPASERLPDLREFLKENDQRLYDFCMYMLHGCLDVDDLILAVFREFGDYYRRLAGRGTAAWEPLEVRLHLFQIAWEHIREELARAQVSWSVGRDTRQMKGLDDDLFKGQAFRARDWKQLEETLLERLTRIDPDFRAPVVLRDIVKFDDEEVARVLGIRWGVYRHRLHRGRLELKDALRGRPFTSEAKGVPLSLSPSPST